MKYEGEERFGSGEEKVAWTKKGGKMVIERGRDGVLDGR